MKRRTFCKAAAAASLSAPSTFAIGQPGPSANSKINVALIGVGGVGQFAFNHCGEGENIVALCDVDWRDSPGGFAKRAAAKHVHRAPDAKRFTDFRKMLDQMEREIDAVVITTPDHTHYPITMDAMQRGIHVCVQKPMARNIQQVRTLQAAAKKYKVQTVMGNQGHCFEGTHRIVEWVRKGILGDVEEVHCWTDRPRLPWFGYFKPTPPPTGPVPDGLNWDLWQGPVADRAYSDEYMPLKWRGWWDYGCGGLGDIGCHVIDAPFWALDLGSPERIEVVEVDQWFNTDYTPRSARLIYHFPAKGDRKAVKLHWYEGKYRPEKLEGMKELPSNGMIIKGSKETVFHEDMRAQSPRLWPSTRMREYGSVLKEKTIPRSPAGHPQKDLWVAIRGDIEACGSNFDYAGPLTEVVLLGAMAIRAKESFDWDPVAMRCSSKTAQQWIEEPVRKGWEYTL
ncbi:MAG: Gfo/Idh/MocA family oxidoreductase [Planctomycetota bacterium]